MNLLKNIKIIFKFQTSLLEKIILKLIRIYQKTFSFDHGFLKIFKPYGQCKFYPSCSEYTYQAIKKYGLFKGGLKSVKRIFKCNPWSKGGIDKP